MSRLLVAVLLVAACKNDPPPEVFVAPSLGSKPHLFGALEGVTLGMTTGDLIGRVGVIHRTDNLSPDEDPELAYRFGAKLPPSESDELKLAHTDLDAPPPPEPTRGLGASPPHSTMSFWFVRDRVHYRVFTSDGVIRRVEIEVPEHTLEDLEKAWGPAVRAANNATYLFLDREKRVRVRVDGDAGNSIQIIFDRYTPLSTIVGADPSSLFGASILGQKLTDAAARLAPYAIEYGGFHVTLPPTEYAADDTRLTLTQDDDGRVTRWQLWRVVDRASDATFEETVDLYMKLWGEPHEVTDTVATFVTEAATIEMKRSDASISASLRPR